MAIGKALIRTLSACPPLSRAALRAYLYAGAPVPAAAAWVLATLEKSLAPPDPRPTVRIGRGLRLQVDLRSPIGRDIYFRGSCEPGVARFLTSHLRPGMTFIDAGANHGECTLRGARLVGPTGRVYAVEASPATMKTLAYNVRLNRLTNTRLIHAALSDCETDLTFYLGRGPASGSSSLSQPHNFTGETVRVAGLTLDALVMRERLTRVDCVKLDVEGSELAAMRGAGRLLSSESPPIVVFEYHHEVARGAGWELADLTRVFESFGYSVHHLSRGGIGPKMQKVDGLVQNLVAAPPPRARRVRR